MKPLVSVELPWGGYDFLRPSLGIPHCDPCPFSDHQMPYIGIEWQLYDDAYGRVQPSQAHVVFPRRGVWKYWRNVSEWAQGETAS